MTVRCQWRSQPEPGRRIATSDIVEFSHRAVSLGGVGRTRPVEVSRLACPDQRHHANRECELPATAKRACRCRDSRRQRREYRNRSRKWPERHRHRLVANHSGSAATGGLGWSANPRAHPLRELGSVSVCLYSPEMAQYVIIPRGRKYWIEATDAGGVRRPVAAYSTEEAALQRLQSLLRKADLAAKPPQEGAPRTPRTWPF